ncbi:Capsular polysaccharide type 8 biosynthesis protein cap8A [Listeria grayi]|uniref:Capsular polysaccharide biosynthesis protein n=2 Tax=Listeria grayi TaxID=1641 RepID=A0A829R7P1_LISGR|nr:Wzz/FepE/Etk N-terminal domain-containing protein [Listeria grayi]EUJ27775.1 capsular polysaccharide biosynthesis protein [Listeria grayi FSL F6-1183]VEI34787.1 Capsular polysaccharide type 8 biosynthesis protein cap8A [Listeria grayi]
MGDVVDLSKVLKVLKQNLKWIVIIPVVFLVITMVLTYFFMTPKYASSTQILVNKKESNSQFMAQEVQSNLQLVNTYAEIIKSPRILESVSKNLDREFSSSEILSMLTVNNQSQSQILNISVRSNSRATSKKVANEVAKVFSKDIKKIMNVDNVSILSKADVKAVQVSPKPLVNAGIGIFLGLIVALLFIFLKQVLDKSLKTEEDVAEILDLPVLGIIQDFRK